MVKLEGTTKPIMIGAAMTATGYFFAFGLGTSIYAAVRLAKHLFWGTGTSNRESTKIGIAMIVGFLCLYSAALLHA